MLILPRRGKSPSLLGEQNWYRTGGQTKDGWMDRYPSITRDLQYSNNVDSLHYLSGVTIVDSLHFRAGDWVAR